MSSYALQMRLQAPQGNQVRLQNARCCGRMNTAQKTGIMRRYASFIPHAEGPDTSGSPFSQIVNTRPHASVLTQYRKQPVPLPTSRQRPPRQLRRPLTQHCHEHSLLTRKQMNTRQAVDQQIDPSKTAASITTNLY